MSQYVCPECGQTLALGAADQPPTMCPTCGIHLKLDATSGELVLPPSLPDTASEPGMSLGREDQNYVRVHRSVIYLQAILLAALAIVGFVLGAGFGGLYTARESPANTSNVACDIQGTVTQIGNQGQEVGVDDAVVVFLPAGKRPDERWGIHGMRPNDDLPPADHPTLIGVRILGGAYTRTDRKGRYGLRVASPGDYHVLVLTERNRRRRDSEWNNRDLAQIGRYFQDAMGLLANNDYRWQKITVTPGERWDVAFDPQS